MSKILIVEDHKDFRHAVRHFLELSKVKAEILEAASGEEGVVVARESRPEIILMDFWLRGINGVEAANQIKASMPESSIIMLTMFDVKDVEPLATHGLFKDFISKSDLFKKLIPSINKILHVSAGA